MPTRTITEMCSKIKKLTLVFLNTDTAFEAVKNGTIDVAAINRNVGRPSDRRSRNH